MHLNQIIGAFMGCRPREVCSRHLCREMQAEYGEKELLSLGEFSEGLQAEEREEEEKMRDEQRESNCQEHFHSSEARHPSIIKPQSLLPCSQDTLERSSCSCAPTELFACFGPACAYQALTPLQRLSLATRLGQPGGWSRGSALQGRLFPAP